MRLFAILTVILATRAAALTPPPRYAWVFATMEGACSRDIDLYEDPGTTSPLLRVRIVRQEDAVLHCGDRVPRVVMLSGECAEETRAVTAGGACRELILRNDSQPGSFVILSYENFSPERARRADARLDGLRYLHQDQWPVRRYPPLCSDSIPRSAPAAHE